MAAARLDGRYSIFLSAFNFSIVGEGIENKISKNEQVMNDFLKVLTSPKNFSDAEKNRRSEILHFSSIALFFVSLVLIIFNYLFGTQEEISLNWSLALIAVSQVIVFGMVRSGYVNQASLFELTATWIIYSIISYNLGGVRDVAIYSYILIILSSSILLGWFYSALYTVASIMAIWWFASLEMRGVLKPNFGNPDRIALDLTVIFILIFIIIYLLIKALTNALESARNELIGRKRIQDELEKVSRTDSLTDLPNRRHFFEMAKKEYAVSFRYNRRLSVIIIDIDQFKGINDKYGHLVGDHVLVHMADLLRLSTRESDTPARLGGDEFVVLLPETDCKAALVFAERFRKLLEAQPLEHENVPISTTVSIGVAEKNTDLRLEGFDLLLSNADQAMYKAKRSGKNQVFCYDDEHKSVHL